MTESKIIRDEGSFKFLINGEKFAPMAYITYFEENNDFKEFTEIGIRLYSVNISFSNIAINTLTGFNPFLKGVFDEKCSPDYSAVNEAFERVLKHCSDAYIFPRIYVTMPKWWINENPDETVTTNASGKREALNSEKFRSDASSLLIKLIDYIENSKYADRIFAYQISGGNTQEWFHFDLKGSICSQSLRYFNEYLKQNNKPQVKALPLPEDIEREGMLSRELGDYLTFLNESVADTVEYFCKVTKKAVNYKKIVGSFYGYTLEVASPLWGTHKLSKLLESSNIDFFSSPNSYNGLRALGREWGDMMPSESIKLHGKLPFIECDIRTHLTKYPDDSRKGTDPKGLYRVPVFKGPEKEEHSLAALRKSLARQLTHNNGMWCFDMFGHWYKSEALLGEIKKFLNICSEEKVNNSLYKAETAIFVDESISARFGLKNRISSHVYNIRELACCCGIPFDIYLIEDFSTLLKNGFDYKACVFISSSENNLLTEAEKYCSENKISFTTLDNCKELFTLNEFREFLKKSGVHIFTENTDVFYIGGGYCSLHSKEKGEKLIKFPKEHIITLPSGNKIKSDTLKINMEKFETLLIRIE